MRIKFLLLCFTFCGGTTLGIGDLRISTAQLSREIMRLGRGIANSLDWSSDGRILAVGGSTGIWLYDINFEETARFEGSNVSSVRWSPQGDKIAFADNAGIHLWSFVEGRKSNESVIFSSDIEVSSLDWSPDGEKLAVATYQAGIQLWNVETDTLLLTIQDAGWDSGWSPDGTRLVAPSSDNYSMYVWDTLSGEKLQDLKGIEEYLFWTSVTWSADGREIAAVSSLPASLHVWNSTTGKIVNSPDTSGAMYSYQYVMWDSDNEQVVVAGGDVTSFNGFGDISLYDAETWEETQRIFVDRIRDVELHPQMGIITGLTRDGNIMEWNEDTGDTIFNNLIFSASSETVLWSPEGDQIATQQLGSMFSVWQLSDISDSLIPKPLFTVDTRIGTYTFGQITINWTGSYGLITIEETSDYNGNVVHDISRRDSSTGEVQRRIVQSVMNGCTFYVSHHFDKAACPQEDVLHIIGIPEGNDLYTLPISGRFLGWSPDDRIIVVFLPTSEGNPSILEFRDAMTGQLIHSYHSFSLQSPVWSGNGEMIAVFVDDGKSQAINIIDAASYETITTIHVEGLYIWSPNSHLLAVAEPDSINFYEIPAGDVVAQERLTGINALDWSSDGTQIALGLNDGTIRIWDVSDIQ